MLHARNIYIDFSFPYDYDGLHAVEKAPTIREPGLMSITAPFTVGAWAGLFVSVLAIAVSLYISMMTSAAIDEGTNAVAKRDGVKSEVGLYVINSLARQAVTNI